MKQLVSGTSKKKTSQIWQKFSRIFLIACPTAGQNPTFLNFFAELVRKGSFQFCSKILPPFCKNFSAASQTLFDVMGCILLFSYFVAWFSKSDNYYIRGSGRPISGLCSGQRWTGGRIIVRRLESRDGKMIKSSKRA